jgi:hypothetical protein
VVHEHAGEEEEVGRDWSDGNSCPPLRKPFEGWFCGGGRDFIRIRLSSRVPRGRRNRAGLPVWLAESPTLLWNYHVFVEGGGTSCFIKDTPVRVDWWWWRTPDWYSQSEPQFFLYLWFR